MSSSYKIEFTIQSSPGLINFNDHLKPYAVVDDANRKSTTRVDEEGSKRPDWNEKYEIESSKPIDDCYLYIDVIDAAAAEGPDRVVGSARLPLCDLEIGERVVKKLDLMKSGSRQDTVDVEVVVRIPRVDDNSAPAAYSA